MFDIPILKRQAPSDPVTLSRDFVKGNGARVSVQSAIAPSDDRARDLIDARMAKGVGVLLHSHYSGHFWEVVVDSKQGICTITIPVLLGNWKYKLSLAHMTPEAVIKAGGEILERFNIPRSAIDVSAFLNAKKHAVSRANHKPPGS